MVRQRVGGLRGSLRTAIVAAGLAGAGLLMTGLAAPMAFAGGTCPLSQHLCLGGTSGSTQPRDSVQCSDPTGQASSFYDLEFGMLQVFVSGQATRANVQVFANDEYMILGPPGGTPVSFAVEFEVSGNVNLSLCGGDGNLGAAFSTVGSPTASTSYACNAACSCFGNQFLNTVLSLPLTRNAGTFFPLGYTLAANGVFGGGNLTGQFRFTGLPPGSSIISCQGYRQDAPVPVQRTSWGTLKVSYR